MRDMLENLYFGKHHPQRSECQIGDCPEKGHGTVGGVRRKAHRSAGGRGKKHCCSGSSTRRTRSAAPWPWENFILGFRLGVRMILEALDENDGSLIDQNKEE